MYIPRAFAEERPAELREIMQSCALPVLVSPVRDHEGDGGGVRMVATHLPLLLSGETLLGHMARANPHWQSFDTSAESLAIFSGVNGYVSPSLYASKQETGKVVPTWNYEAVHAYGRLEIIEDPARILAVVSSLTDHHEAPRKAPWKVSDAPEDYIAAQLKGIVALVLHITSVQGVRKLSQNKSPADREGVIAGHSTENPLLAQRMSRRP
jgi:transcriptional regulator